MPEAPTRETPGERLKTLRKRAALSQAELGLRVNLSQGRISQLEKGDIALDKVSLVNELARALHCHPREILGTPGYGDAADRGDESANELVRWLRRLDLPPQAAEHRPLPELAAELNELVRLRGHAQYAELGARTVQLVTELHAATQARALHDREQAHRLLTHACKEVHSFAYGLGHAHLVELATFRARWNAERSDDPLLPALADYMAALDAWTTARAQLVNLGVPVFADAPHESQV